MKENDVKNLDRTKNKNRALSGFSGGSDDRIHPQCWRSGLDPWTGKIP